MVDLKLVKKAMGELDEDQVMSALNEFMKSNPSEEDTLKVMNACQQGMSVVGDLFDKGEYFVGDLIYAGELLNKAIDTIKPALEGKTSAKVGKMVLGTVQGDMHDIGKNIFKSLAESAGFEIYDLGIDTPPEDFVSKVKEVKADIVGMSGVLTLASNAMKETVDSLKNADLRENVKIIIGGNLVTNDVCSHVGADAFTTNAAEGVKICQGWVK
ncbi:MAG TPA: cobalamin-binding protein [Syntrophomonadaceae bacterium]|nr:cobalamin-binding protein [Syntrophomonadaceae bacterium]